MYVFAQAVGHNYQADKSYPGVVKLWDRRVKK